MDRYSTQSQYSFRFVLSPLRLDSPSSTARMFYPHHLVQLLAVSFGRQQLRDQQTSHSMLHYQCSV